MLLSNAGDNKEKSKKSYNIYNEKRYYSSLVALFSF